MDKLPFSVYDFFAYLSSGAVLLITADYVFALDFLRQTDVGVLLGLAIVILAYITGQAVAQFASFALEQLVVNRILSRPSEILLGERSNRSLAWLFPYYFRPLPPATRERVLAQTDLRGFTGTGEALFLHAYAVVTDGRDALQRRLDTFRDQYGFARNVSFALFVAAISIFAAHNFSHHPVGIRWAVIAAFGSLILFYRYLKFFRQYSYELFLRYAEIQPPAAENSKERVTNGNYPLLERE